MFLIKGTDQDTVHILAKLRTRLVTSSNLLVLGEKTACKEHLRYLANHTDKDKHGLTARSINEKDKQNFDSIGTLVSDDVLKCLEEISKTMQTEGTICYLQIMRNIRDAFLDKSISPLHRIFLMWKSIFILRIWRTWLDENGYAQSEHFITPNAYTCIEVNGHMLVNIVLRVVNGSLPPESLRVWKAGSQSCEQLFRLIRSMTPTFSTIINFTLKGLLDRVHKLTFLGAMEATGEIEFPRAKRRLLQLKQESDVTLRAPSSMIIYTRCFADAKNRQLLSARSCQ